MDYFAGLDANLFAQHSPDNKQRFNQQDQVGKVLDQLLDTRYR